MGLTSRADYDQDVGHLRRTIKGHTTQMHGFREESQANNPEEDRKQLSITEGGFQRGVR